MRDLLTRISTPWRLLVSGTSESMGVAPRGIPRPLCPFLKGLAAAVLGGLTSLPGALVGGLILGVAESLAGAYVAIEFKNTLAFLVIIAVLLIRPEGLLGRVFKERV